MKAKRFLSLILVAVMLIGLMPMVSLAADTVKNPVYLFSNSAFNASGQYHMHMGTNELDRTKSTGYYEYVYHVGLDAFPLTDDALMAWNDDEAEFGNSAIILSAKVDEAGLYDIKTNYIRQKYSGKMGVYLIPKTYADATWDLSAPTDISAIVSSEKTVKLVHQLDTNTAAGTDTFLVAEDIILSENDFYIMITVDKSAYPTNDGTRYYSIVKSLEFTQKKMPTGNEKYVTYSFTSTGRSDISTHGAILEDKNGVWNAGLSEYPRNPAHPGEMWAYNGMGIGYAVSKSYFANLVRYLGTNKYNHNDWIAFRIKVPATGTYILDSGTAYKYGNSSSNMKMYLVPMDDNIRATFAEGNKATFGTTSDARGTGYYLREGYKLFPELGISEDYLIGKTNLLKSGDNFDDPLELSDIKEMELRRSMEYLLILRAESAGVPSVSTLTFEYEEKPIVLDHIDASFGEDNTVLIGSKLTPSVKWYSDEEEISGENGEISVKVLRDDDEIIVEDKEGNLYVSKAGEIKLEVSGVLGGVEKTCEVTVNVIEDNSYSGANMSYRFHLKAYSDTGAVGFIPEDGFSKESFLAGVQYQDYSDERPWGLVAAKASRPNSGKQYFSQNANYMDLSGVKDDWVAFKVKVPKAGKYTVDATGYTYKSAGRAEIYMLPYKETMTFDDITANINTYASEDTFVAEADFNGSDDAPVNYSGVGTFVASDEVDYSKGYGDYLMIVKTCASKINPGAVYVLLHSIHLVGSAGIETAGVSLSDKVIGIGEGTKIIEVFAKNKTGGAIDLSDAYISHKVAEGSEDIIELSDDGETVTAKSEGTGEIETLILIEGSVAKVKTEITVDDNLRILDAYLYSTSIATVGENINFFTRVELNNKKLVNIGEITGYEIVEESAPGVLTVSADGKLIKAATAGSATVRAKLSARGKVFDTDTVTVTVSEVDMNYPSNFTIDFRKGVYSGDTYTDADQIKTYTSYRNWIYHSFVGAYQPMTLAEKTATYCLVYFNGAKPTNYFALKVMFPKSGIYTVETTGLVRDRAPELEMFVIPATSENEENLASLLVTDNEYHFGTANFYNATEEINQVRSFGTNEIKNPGEYFVVFRPLPRTGWGGDVWYPIYTTFTDSTSVSKAELVAAEEKNEIEVNETLTLSPKFKNGAGEDLGFDESLLSKLIYKSSDEEIATVSENGVVEGKNEGTAKITADIVYDGVALKAEYEVSVKDNSGIDMNLGIETMADGPIYAYATTNIILKVAMNSGRWVEIPSEYITYEVVSGGEFADVAPDGTVTGREVGTITVQPSVSPEYKEGIENIEVAPVSIEVQWDATVNPAVFTLEERENARRNASRYDWAKETVDSAVAAADKYLERYEDIYELAVPEGLPRWYHVGHTLDPKKFYCRYCNCNIGLEYGSYGWKMNAFLDPWKIQCPDCKRQFPSNDFGSFFNLGLSESGSWSYEKALREHHKLFVCENGAECACENAPHPKNDRMSDAWIEYYGFGKGYLANKLYADMDKKLGVVGWGVDDSLGYMQPYISPERAAEIAGPGGDLNSVPGYDARYYDHGDGYAWYRDGASTGPVQHTYIAYYNHEAIWYGAGGDPNGALFKKAIIAFRDAFLFTGEPKYGRAGAILLDKVADLYPDFEWYQWGSWRGDSYRGKIVDPVWECGLSQNFAGAFDAFLPIYNDPYVAEFLSKRAPRYEKDENGDWKRDENGNLIPVNLKNSPGALRKHVEDNLLLEIYDSVLYGKIWGNFGMHQHSLATAALALNRLPETGEMLDWLMRDGAGYNTGAGRADPIAGGYIMTQLINVVDRDGHGNENALGYNNGWINNLSAVAELLSGYELYPSADLYKNPKFVKMYLAQAKLTLGGYYGPQTGDSGAVASTGIIFGFQPSIALYQVTKDRELARAIYMTKDAKGNLGLRGTIYDKEPEIEKEIEKIVEEDGRYSLTSEMAAGYGFAALRAGAYYDSASAMTRDDTNRDMAIYFGSGSAHGHLDCLNLYMSAFGLNVAPDLGYPEQTGAQPNRYEWVRTTISHNTVVVNEKEQKAQAATGNAYHFDDSGRVKLMDVSADVYKDVTDEYRRSVFMVEVSDDISYGVDFFHVKGGSDHLYSFHSQSDELSAVSGLSELEVTPMYTDELGNLYGTYAGPDVKYGADPGGVNTGTYPRGYTWLKNVRTYNGIEKDFSVEFNVKDWRKVMEKNRDVRLRLTMVNDEPLDEVTFATAVPPQTVSNKGIGDLDYLLVRRKGDELDTVFTTVLEPYDAADKYIEKIEKVSMEREPGQKPGLNDAFSAVKITLKNGRVDYIIYATNNSINYTVDDKISFRGFGGVISFENIEGEESIVYSYLHDGEVLKLLDDESEETKLAAYTGKIKSFTKDFAFDNSIVYTPDEGQSIDVSGLSGKYVYVENDGVENAAYRIESASMDGNDVVLDIGDVTTIRSFIDASDMERGYVYNIGEGQSLRIPMPSVEDSSPVFDVIDDKTTSVDRSITIPIKVESPVEKEITLIGTSVPRGMTIDPESMTITWKPTSSQIGENHVAITASDGTLETTEHFTVTVYGSTTGETTGGGTTVPTTPTTPDTDNESLPLDGKEPVEGETDEVETGDAADVRFIDLGNHAWAADSINSLADDGIVKGTTHNTYSPASNITRADFALLLVRAFELSSENTENFADVNDSDYFAAELAIARNTGIVNGIGDNKYAPRNTITRQDMMVITYRALESLGVELATSDVEYPDFDKVAPYAQDAVKALITSGLVNGKSGKIAPNDYTTRAEVAVLLKRILEYTAN